MKIFSAEQMTIVDHSVVIAEELVCNFYKMSANQWLRHRYDVKTLCDLSSEEIVDGPFAQVVRYAGRHHNATLGSAVYDFYKICLQDNAILSALRESPALVLSPFLTYILVHELIHIVRFAKFYQQFHAPPEEKQREEARVHDITRSILNGCGISGMAGVLDFYANWQESEDGPEV
ncbi:MAG: hypothetical protein SWH61_09650 [Thermodesulfobacteriota bacterium]|nr:hypothetical protein [Thermodesulfobacteriota bacterium]